MIGGGLAEVLAWLATAELTGDVSEVHIDTFTYELIVFELVQYGHPGVKWSTRRRNTSPVNVLGTAHTNLNEQMVAPWRNGPASRWKSGNTENISTNSS